MHSHEKTQKFKIQKKLRWFFFENKQLAIASIVFINLFLSRTRKVSLSSKITQSTIILLIKTISNFFPQHKLTRIIENCRVARRFTFYLEQFFEDCYRIEQNLFIRGQILSFWLGIFSTIHIRLYLYSQTKNLASAASICHWRPHCYETIMRR